VGSSDVLCQIGVFESQQRGVLGSSPQSSHDVIVNCGQTVSLMANTNENLDGH